MKTKEGNSQSDQDNITPEESTAETLGEMGNANEQALPDAETAEANALAKLEAELSESQDRLLRLSAEFANYQKRVARDRIEQSKMAGADVFLAILPVIDDFERAIKAAEVNENTQSVREGVQLIYNKLRSITESKGLKAMESNGKPFDSDLHDAIANVTAPSEELKGKVVEEIEKGYYLNDKVIRHAKVIVGI
jgi:molecular chaperone GrpE